MTTHLEEALGQFDEKFTTLYGTPVIVRGELKEEYALLNTDNADEIRNFIINSHIKYLESEETRLKVELTDKHKSPHWYSDDYYTALENELNHKQQELLQAKELLK